VALSSGMLDSTVILGDGTRIAKRKENDDENHCRVWELSAQLYMIASPNILLIGQVTQHAVANVDA
jgi:hypothetical protein